MTTITSKNNPLVKETALLKDKKARKESGLFLVEGKKMVAEVFQSGLRVVRVFTLEENAEQYPVETIVVSREVMQKLSDEKTPQGVLCVVEIPRATLQKPTGACLVVDGVSDPGNMGAILRTANASGYKEVYLTDDCTDPYAPKAVRSSMSGLFFETLYFGSREEIVSALDGTPIVVADLDGENAFTCTLSGAFALVVGNEANGVSQTLKNASSRKITVPMAQNQESLNVSVAAGICMYLLKKDEFSKV